MNSLFSPEYRQGHYKPFVQGYYDRPDMLGTTAPNEAAHRHIYNEIMYVSAGQTTIEVNDQRVPLNARQYIFIESDVKHRIILSKSRFSMINIEFDLRPCAQDDTTLLALAVKSAPLRRMLSAPAPYRVLNDPDGLVSALLKQTVMLASSRLAPANDLCARLVGMILLAIATRWTSEAYDGLQGGETPSSQVDPRVKTAIKHMHAHFDEALSTRELAQEAGLNPAYFARLFREWTGLSPAGYLETLRLNQARALLLSSDDSVLSISAAVGYAGEGRFTRAFRDRFGMTPAQFRAGQSSA
ncbi:MAG: AraC family transcriptional regulator [Oscillospiraceae bacterium]|jgi:AraC-like DNA-binding protein|nr:AraC family transcriptional regulator [Oscillospiraceae bacterium]